MPWLRVGLHFRAPMTRLFLTPYRFQNPVRGLCRRLSGISHVVASPVAFSSRTPPVATHCQVPGAWLWLVHLVPDSPIPRTPAVCPMDVIRFRRGFPVCLTESETIDLSPAESMQAPKPPPRGSTRRSPATSSGARHLVGSHAGTTDFPTLPTLLRLLLALAVLSYLYIRVDGCTLYCVGRVLVERGSCLPSRWASFGGSAPVIPTGATPCTSMDGCTQ